MDPVELNGRYEGRTPLIPISLPHGDIEAILDTGFDTHLMLPTPEFERLSPLVELVADVTTASGLTVPSRARRIRMTWLGQEIEVNAIECAAGFVLAGMGLLEDVETLLRPAEGILRIRRTR